jgi:hypothetical protein
MSLVPRRALEPQVQVQLLPPKSHCCHGSNATSGGGRIEPDTRTKTPWGLIVCCAMAFDKPAELCCGGEHGHRSQGVRCLRRCEMKGVAMCVVERTEIGKASRLFTSRHRVTACQASFYRFRSSGEGHTSCLPATAALHTLSAWPPRSPTRLVSSCCLQARQPESTVHPVRAGSTSGYSGKHLYAVDCVETPAVPN